MPGISPPRLTDPPYPNSNCVVCDPSAYVWHDQQWRPPDLSDLIIYQLHVGTFLGRPGDRVAKFLDVLDQFDYLRGVGVNAIEPLPVTEFCSRDAWATTAPTFSPRRWILRRPPIWTLPSESQLAPGRKGLAPMPASNWQSRGTSSRPWSMFAICSGWQ